MRRVSLLVVAAVVAAGLAAAAGPAHGAASAARAVVDGAARFEVLTPRLIRLEYASDHHFQDEPTFNAVNRSIVPPPYTVTNRGGTLTITTSQLTLRYLDDSGPFTLVNLSIHLADGTTAHPSFTSSAPGNLGGWYRDLQFLEANDDSKPLGKTLEDMPLYDGVLTTSGWYLLDDTTTALLTGGGQAEPRPAHLGPYQDGYFFGYGTDDEAGLEDLATLTGPPVMLPEWAFGVWFSDYASLTATQEEQIAGRFRAEGLPLDSLVVDTDWKAPDTWNGWSWNPRLFPNPVIFLQWARSQGINVTLNIHPSIDSTDPHFAATQAASGGTLRTSSGDCAFYRSNPPCYVFNWGNPAQAAAYFDLQKPLLAEGVKQLWLDWCCDASTVSTPGLTGDSWINHLYAQFESATGSRGFALSRIGSSLSELNGILPFYPDPASGPWAEHRSTVHFTGDAPSTWDTLAYEAAFTQQEANIDMAYVSDDIGGYEGGHLPDDLYVRWVQFGAFQPILRLHSRNGDRLPWQYSPPARSAADDFLRLRDELVPYLYTTAREAYDTGLAMVRSTAVSFPGAPTSTAHEYMLGDNLLVAPVITPGSVATTSVWIPPGTWTSFFTDQSYRGPATVDVTSTLDTMPVFVRAGAVIPMAPAMTHVGAAPDDPLTLVVGPGASGVSSLYADSGDGFGYEHGQYTFTGLRYTQLADGGRVTVDPPSGHGSVAARRGYVIRFLGAAGGVRSVTVDGRVDNGWTYDAATRTLAVTVPSLPTSSPVVVAYAS